MDDAKRPETQTMGLFEVGFHDGFDIPRGYRMEIENIRDGNPDRFVIHRNMLAGTDQRRKVAGKLLKGLGNCGARRANEGPETGAAGPIEVKGPTARRTTGGWGIGELVAVSVIP